MQIHPDFDAVLLSILQRDPCGHVVMIEGSNSAWNDAVVRGQVVYCRLAFLTSTLCLRSHACRRVLLTPGLGPS